MLNLASLNQRVNALTAKVNNIVPGGENLATTLTNGNSAGTSDINMNNKDILAVDNINLVTINNLAYPPAAAVNTLQQVLLAGNNAGATSIDMNTQPITNISTATAKTSVVVNNSVTGANATLTQSNLTINATGLSGLPSLTLNQSGVGVGNLTEEFYNQRTAQVGEFNRMSFYAKNSAGAKTEYARFHQNAPVVTSGSVRGRIDFAVQTGSGLTDYLILILFIMLHITRRAIGYCIDLVISFLFYQK